jgi:hypothetical protein
MTYLKVTYNTWLKYKHLYLFRRSLCDQFYRRPGPHASVSTRASAMTDITDAGQPEPFVGLKQRMDQKTRRLFLSRSPINFSRLSFIWEVQGTILYLYRMLLSMQLDYDSLFTILRTEKEVRYSSIRL